jgi:hypothetical protein
MLKAEQIERSMDQAEPWPTDAVQRNRLPAEPKPMEARSQPGEVPSNASAEPTKRPDTVEPSADRDSRTSRHQLVRWFISRETIPRQPPCWR